MASLAALPVGAQEKSARETKASSSVPQSAQPPAGLCRVWLENVPESQQPAPTDCATAIKNRPNHARIVFGDLSKEAAKPAKSQTSGTDERANGWPNRMVDPPRRFDTSPGIPARQAPADARQNDARHDDARPTDPRRNDASGVQPASATAPVIRRPSSDSGNKRRP